MKVATAPTYAVRLYLSGPIEVAKQIIRAAAIREGICVTIEPTLFVYSGGEETGYVVGLVNYPRFPSEPRDIADRARHLLHLLMEGTHQWSGLMVTPTTTEWFTTRPDGVA